MFVLFSDLPLLLLYYNLGKGIGLAGPALV